MGFFFLFTFGLNKPPYHSQDKIDEAFEWLYAAINTTDEHKFIVTHAPVYGTGRYGSFPDLAKRMEQFLDDNAHERIRAVFTGHDHVFAAFKRKQRFLFVNGVGGGNLDPPYMWGENSPHRDRKWAGVELHGPLKPDG